jgi:hypothetical protein
MYAISIGFAIGCRGEPERLHAGLSPATQRGWVRMLERLGHQTIRAIAVIIATFADSVHADSSRADVDIHGVEAESDLETSRDASSPRGKDVDRPGDR